MEYTICSDKLTARVASHGAELCSLQTGESGELMWQADPAVWPRHAPVCFPWCGKVQGGTFIWQGREYAAPTQHGFVRDMEHTLTAQTGDSLRFRLDWPGDSDGWFWPFAFETVHTLEGNTVLTTCTAENTGTQPMPVQMGFHPGFVCPFGDGGAVEDYEVRFESGLVVPLEPHLFDNDSIFYENVGAWARLTCRPTGQYIGLDTAGFDRVLLWSKPGIPGFVCIEPWCGYPGPQRDMAERPYAVVLAPGEKRSWTQRITVEI